MLASAQAEGVERAVDAPLQVARPAGEADDQLHVVARGQERPEVAALENDRQLACAIAGQLGIVGAGQRTPEDADLPGRRLVKPGRELQGGGLARP